MNGQPLNVDALSFGLEAGGADAGGVKTSVTGRQIMNHRRDDVTLRCIRARDHGALQGASTHR
jgi:hypothetical protein